MDPLLTVMLFWALVYVAMALFGIACIKWGVYTSGGTRNPDYKPTLEI